MILVNTKQFGRKIEHYLLFNFSPKSFSISANNNGIASNYLWSGPMSGFTTFYSGLVYNTDLQLTTGVQFFITWGSNSVNYYSNLNSTYQLNNSSSIFYYIGFG